MDTCDGDHRPASLRLDNSQIGTCNLVGRSVASSLALRSTLLIRFWPPAFLVLGLALTATWIGLLGYGGVVVTELAFGYYGPVAKASSGLAVKPTAPDARQVIQATNIKDGSQAIIIPCKSPRIATIVGALKTTSRISRGISTAYFTSLTGC